MPLNITASYLESLVSPGMLCFSAQLGTTSQYLLGPGGQGGDGIPIPWDGKIVGLRVTNTVNQISSTAEIPMSKGDRIALYANYTVGNTYTITLILNGFASVLEVNNIPQNSTVMATLAFYFTEDFS